MRRPIAILAAVLATSFALAACGGGSNNDTTAAAAAPADGGGTSAANSVPQVTGTKVGEEDEDTEEKLPTGAPLDQAEAAGLGTDGAPVISVTTDETSCLPDTSTVPAGKVWFKVTNNGQKINELYLEDTEGNELAEVENVKAGEAGAFEQEVNAGSYQLACAPGMGDVQIRTPLTVTGS